LTSRFGLKLILLERTTMYCAAIDEFGNAGPILFELISFQVI